MFNFLHTYQPEPLLFKIGLLEIHWYGFLMVVGGLLGFWLTLKLANYYKIKKEQVYELLFYFVIGAVIGARIYYVVYAWELYQDNWLDVFKIWQGGLAVHGVMLGGFLATLLFCCVKKLNFWLIADLAATALVAGQIIGRIGNYFNQEIFGKPTDLPWGIPIDALHRPAGFVNFKFFHPTFLYEVLGSLIILGVLLSLHWLRFKRKKQRVGNIFIIYLILYSTQRFLLEFLRLDYSPLVFGVRWAQLLSGGVIIAAGIYLLWRNFCRPK